MPGAMHATIGHVADEDEDDEGTTAYHFLRGGQAYVECTLQPSGGRVVARVNVADSYEVFSFGARVSLLALNGDPNAAVLAGKLHDDNDPIPASVAGNSIPVEGPVFDADTNARFARRVQFIQAAPDRLEILVVPDTEWNPTTAELLKEYVRRTVGETMKTAVHAVKTEDLCRDPSGKLRAIIGMNSGFLNPAL